MTTTPFRPNNFLAVLFVVLVFICLMSSKTTIYDGLTSRFNISRIEPRVAPAMDSVCQCRPIAELGSLARSTCSPHSTARGPGQVVFSYALYGNLSVLSHYASGILTNLRKIKEFFPGAVMRLYYENYEEEAIVKNNRSAGLRDICKIFCENDHLDLCDSRELDTYGNIGASYGRVWRFAAMTDPLVKEFHSRDLDSLITAREQVAVGQFRNDSGALYHVMRDHPYHGVAILAGMFGVKITQDNIRSLNQVFRQILCESKKWSRNVPSDMDQNLLRQYLWPLMNQLPGTLMSHDSYTCKSFPGSRPFPTQRITGPNFTRPAGDHNFVGSSKDFSYISLNISGKCPEECRPKNHIDWLLC